MELRKTDPEFAERFQHFAFDEVVNEENQQLDATNDIFMIKGIELPLPGQAATTMDNRLEKGIEAQAEIFGEQMKEAWKAGHINRWLAANCFGDFYTRTGLDLKQREMITFCFLMAQGGCEPQLKCHKRYSEGSGIIGGIIVV